MDFTIGFILGGFVMWVIWHFSNRTIKTKKENGTFNSGQDNVKDSN